ncbi:MAG TPA: DUF1836 domain-containing protein [Desulfobacteria bacterium]|nr:DUF1836 domain-containing protein [Desulfobacteria bacterium]
MPVEQGKMILEILDKLAPKEKAYPYLELDTMMLAQVVDVANLVTSNELTSTHIQNWVRRKYIPNPVKKKYSRDQVANILLINELRSILSLEQVSQLLAFVNLDPLETSDDRISPAKLYRHYGEIFDGAKEEWQKSLQQLEQEVQATLAGEELADQDRETVATTLVILTLLARANFYKQIAEAWLSSVSEKE